MREIKSVAVAFLVGVAAAALLLELGLRMYNPFGFRLKGSEIIPPSGKLYRIEHHSFSRLDPVITHTKNSLGFRGPELSAALPGILRIVAVGGSTTECFYLSDGTTWPDRLAQLLASQGRPVWLNNAGMDGHSTYGHLKLIEQHLASLKPQIAVFLVGLNDLGLPELKDGGGWLSRAARHSELLSLLENLSRYLEARRKGLSHRQLDLEKLPLRQLSPEQGQKIAARYKGMLEAYRKRVLALIRASRAVGMEPVFVTQPALYGFGRDPRTGVDLASVRTELGNGEVSWRIMEMYNDIVRAECLNEKVLCVDLARKMPKDSEFYYDFYHFTPAGAGVVASIINLDLRPFIEARYPRVVEKAKK